SALLTEYPVPQYARSAALISVGSSLRARESTNSAGVACSLFIAKSFSKFPHLRQKTSSIVPPFQRAVERLRFTLNSAQDWVLKKGWVISEPCAAGTEPREG